MENINNRIAAIFIDYENINQTDSYARIFDLVKKNGFNPCIRKIICSTYPKKADFIDVIKSNYLDLNISYKPIKKARSKLQKEKNLNNADFRMYTEVLKMLYSNSNVDCFVICSSDDDYIELIATLKESGKYLIGFGNKKTTSPYYSSLFDKFYFIDDINESVKETDSQVKKEIIISKSEEIVSKKSEKAIKESKPKAKEAKSKEDKQNSKKTNASKKAKSKKADENKEKKDLPSVITSINDDSTTKNEKDQIFYSILKNAIEEELNLAAETSKENSYAVSLLISKIKSESLYFQKYKKITLDDVKKCGFEIHYENGKKETGYINFQK